MPSTVSKVLAPPSIPRHFTTSVVYTSSSRGRVGDDQAEILERYSGQIPGSLWALGLPLLTMGIYIFAFLIWSGAAYSIGLFLQPIFN